MHSILVMTVMKPHLYKSQLILAVVALLLSACAMVQFGHDFDIKAFEHNVERMVTTKKEVKQWLGAPSSRGYVVSDKGERSEKWGYFYGSGKLPDLNKATLKMLEVEFHHQGIVQRYNWSE